MEFAIASLVISVLFALLSLLLDLNYVEIGLLLLCALGLRFFRRSWFDRVERAAARLANRRAVCIALAFFAPILFRVAVLPWAPVPVPWVPDEFSHLLIADTLAHGRLANPMHPLWMHFESIHIVTAPVYASIYFPGLGIVMALGQILGNPWIGVLLSSGAMCAALLWMAYGILPPRWALLAGVLAVLRWGALSYWVNSYWGGTVTAAAGALVLGAYLRIRRRSSVPLGLTLGFGVVCVALHAPPRGRRFRHAHRRRARLALLPDTGVVATAARGDSCCARACPGVRRARDLLSCHHRQPPGNALPAQPGPV
jgi:hypothetical protein